MTKNKKILLILIVTIIILVTGNILYSKNRTDKDLEKYLISKGFEEEEKYYVKTLSSISEDEYFNKKSKKENSQFSQYLFDIVNYDLYYVKFEYVDGIELTLNATYSFKNETLEYKHNTYYQNVNIMLNGIYNDKFTCEIVYSNNDVDSKTICNSIKLELELFKTDLDQIFTSYYLKEQMKNN